MSEISQWTQDFVTKQMLQVTFMKENTVNDGKMTIEEIYENQSTKEKERMEHQK